MSTRVVFASVILSFFLSLEAIVIRFLNVKEYNVPFEQIVILVEVFKFIVSLGLYWWNTVVVINDDIEDFYDANETLLDTQSETQSTLLSDWNWGNIYYYILPAAVYTISNNVTYLALKELAPAMFNLLMNFKIPFTGILAYVCLSYRMTPMFICSYILLSLSTVFASLNFSSGNMPTLDTSVLGLLYMLIYTSCSASGAILMELLTRIKFKYTSIYIQNVKFSLMNIFCNLVVIMIRHETPFINMNWVHLVVIVVSGVYGLITAVVIKFGGSILKTYSVTVSVFISALLSYIIWGVYYTWNFYVGSVLCMCAVYMYTIEYHKIKSEHSINEIVLETDRDMETDRGH
jgi:drug/metabolite transporter (DMT)-like permease